MNDQVLHKNDHNEEHSMELLFADLFKKHEYRLHTLVLKLTRSNQYARDIIQEVFLKLWEHRYQLHTIQNIEAWLYRLTENKELSEDLVQDSFVRIWKNIGIRTFLSVNMRTNLYAVAHTELYRLLGRN